MKTFLRNNGLSLVMFGLFLLFLVGPDPAMKEYDCNVPQRSYEVVPFSPVQLTRLKESLVKRFGGLTCFLQWQLGAVTFRDEIVTRDTALI